MPMHTLSITVETQSPMTPDEMEQFCQDIFSHADNLIGRQFEDDAYCVEADWIS